MVRQKKRGFDPKELDKSVRPEDDFFSFVNRKWLKNNPIPAEETRWGSFIILRKETEVRLKHLVTSFKNKLIQNFYRSGMDMKRRNSLGTKPLASLLSRIAAVQSVRGLVDVIAHLERVGGSTPWRAIVDQDMKDATRYVLYLEQGGLGMPDRDYYLQNEPDKKRVREAYQKHIVKLLMLSGDSAAEAKQKMSVVMRLETALAKASMDKVLLRDPDNVYHKKTLRELARLAPTVEWSQYLAGINAPHMRHLIVSQPKFVSAVGRMISSVPLEDWKIYLSFHVVNGYASVLSEPFVKENFAFYATALTGTKVMKPLWRRALSAVNASVPDELGKAYVKKYFPQSAKRQMDALIDDLFAAYEPRIKALEWMSAATKKKALVKLHSMTRKIGYPARWKSYKGLVNSPLDYVGNIMRADEYEHRRQVRRIGKKVDRFEWFTAPQVVNAFYNPVMNEIVFPAAILQPPFFDPHADAALNYGSIGAVIGHEITHGFDDSGAKFDSTGNLKNWWTSADKKRFEQKSALLARQFDRYEVAPGVPVNGKLTLGENIADLGGAAIAYDAYQRHLAKHPAEQKSLGGFSPEQRFFIAFALFEREQARAEYLKMIVTVDSHSPSRFRINGPASNLDSFYGAFGVAPGDKLYRTPKERARIW